MSKLTLHSFSRYFSDICACVIFIKGLIYIKSPINCAYGRRNFKDLNDRMLSHVPMKHARDQNKVLFSKSYHF